MPPLVMKPLNRLFKEWDLSPGDILQRDYARLSRETRRGLPDKHKERLLKRLQQSARKVRLRGEAVPALRYDDQLPITASREDLVRAIQQHQVLVVAGDTGSGKSTQLPKLCLEAGRGRRGLIGCTQPRRIAARSVAARVAEELQVSLGELVGFQVRFTDRSDERTLIKFMTDGILLAEIPHDRWLDEYDTLIIDEAHERSLNIDFLLGYLKRVLPRRPDLRVIITSATIDTERFSKHFNNAPVFQIEGRTYPVEVRYQPPEDDSERDRFKGIVNAVEELNRVDPRGDVLVFLSGEREIREAANRLRQRNFRQTQILPLYARLSQAAQMRIFKPGRERRIVLATNVAETSLTVPRIRFVIDTGVARISRYSHRSRIQRLPIEAVSQASADQRKGRCGRLGPGVCIRLYSEEDFLGRPEFTEPEILRTSLASVILRLQAMRLGEVEDFPFIDPPARAMISDAFQLLLELQAVDAERQLTPVGRKLSRLPVDVRLGRMLLEGERLGCLREMLILAAVLGIQDPRERPLEQAQAADEAQRQFQDPASDFAAFLNLWRWVGQQRAELGSAAYRRQLEQHFLSWQRLREWQDLRHQLAEICHDAGMKPNVTPAASEVIHWSLLSGLLSHVGLRDEEDGSYHGARGRRFHIFPGSGLFKTKKPWVMCAEIVETARVYGRVAAVIKPEWLERQGAHLLREHYFDPAWDARNGQVMGYLQLTLYGLIVVEKRRVHYGPHDEAAARRLLIEHALVQGEMPKPLDFIKANQQLVATVSEEEHKRRRHDLLVRDERLVAFFAPLLPDDIYTAKAFKQWYHAQPNDIKQQFFYDRELLLQKTDALSDAEAFPDEWEVQGQRFSLAYHFEPGSEQDGVTLTIPLHALNLLSEEGVSWLAPGLLEEKAIALLNTLPKPLRRAVTPTGQFARAALQHMTRKKGHFVDMLAAEIQRMTGLEIPRAAWQPNELSPHLRMNIRVLDKNDHELGQGRDLTALQENLGGRARTAFMNKVGADWHQDGFTEWSFGNLPEQVETKGGGQAWLALVDQHQAVGIRLFENLDEAQNRHYEGMLRLLRMQLGTDLRYLEKNSGLNKTTGLHYAPLGRLDELRSELIEHILNSVAGSNWHVRDESSFKQYCSEVREALIPTGMALGKAVSEIFALYHRIQRQLAEWRNYWNESLDDIQSQLDDLVYSGFLDDVSSEKLKHYPRYLQGIIWRLEKLEDDPGRDEQRLSDIKPWWRQYLEYIENHAYTLALDEYRWLLEEYRVSLFAQHLKTVVPVSAKRLEKAWVKVLKS